MSMNIRFPNITGVSEAEQLIQIKSYLYQLVEQLNWMLPTIEASTGQAGTSSTNPSFGDISSETFYELKSLLIKSSDTLNAYYEKINAKLEGQYVKQTDFDEHKQEVPQHINDALAQAKESGEFDGPPGPKGPAGAAGKDGYTPVKGVDYFTEEDKTEIVDAAIATVAGKLQQIIVSISLPASEWVGSGNLYSQVVAIDGITENSQVNLTPSVEQLSIFYEKDVTFVTENDGGVVTVYVIGQKPTNDYTIKASVVEVSHE